MNRSATIIKSSKDYGSSYKRHVCIDIEMEDEIYECISKKRKKFWYVIERTLTQPMLYWDCYGKEEVNSRAKCVSAIKFFDVDNTRIYCKEITSANGNFFIICAAVLWKKKVHKNNFLIIEILEKIAKYEYTIC